MFCLLNHFTRRTTPKRTLAPSRTSSFSCAGKHRCSLGFIVSRATAVVYLSKRICKGSKLDWDGEVRTAQCLAMGKPRCCGSAHLSIQIELLESLGYGKAKGHRYVSALGLWIIDFFNAMQNRESRIPMANHVARHRCPDSEQQVMSLVILDHGGWIWPVLTLRVMSCR